MIDKLISKNTRFLVIFFITLIMIISSGYSYYKNKLVTKQLVVVAGGEPSSESYKIMAAVAKIANNEDFDFRMKVVKTHGSIENAQLLKENLVQMATSQANLQIDNKTRIVANLYEEVFHFIVQPGININSIEEVKGLKVAIPSKRSGENFAYTQLNEHFGLGEDRIQSIISTWKSATWLFENGNIDAIFKVREPNHSEIKAFVNEMNAHSEAITQAEAIALNFPMYHKSTIPRGSYNGTPPNPAVNVETLGIDKLLVATTKLPAAMVSKIATILFTRKRELTEFTSVGGLAKVPSENSLIPWHDGLLAFVNKEKPNFFQKNAEFLALILSVFILLGSSFIQFFNRSKQKKLNGYNEELLSIKVNVEQTHNIDDLMKLREEHYALVNQIVNDAVHGKISGVGFEFFAFGWDSVTNLINDKEKTLRNER